MDVRLPDGTIISNIPDGTSKADIIAKLKSGGYDTSKLEAIAAGAPAPEEPARGTVGDYAGAIGSGVMALNKNLASLPAGVLRGVTDVTDTAALLGARGLDYLVPRGQAPETTREEDIQASIDRRKAQYNKMWGDQAPADVGRLGGQIVATLPIGGAVAAPLKAAANMAPSLAKFLTPVARSLETGGFQTGTTGAANVAAKTVGGAVTGGLAAEAVEPGPGETGALIGAAVPTIAAPAVKGAYNYATRVMDPKTNQLLNWFEGKGQAVLNTLRRPNATIVPGTEPHLGDVASSVGGAKLAAGVADVRSTPAFATERAAQEAQTNQARLAQEARVQNVAEAAKQKKIDELTARIDSGLVTENPDAIGAGLKTIALKEKAALKPVITQAYKDAFALAPTEKIDVGNVIKKAEEILGQPLSEINVVDQPDIVKKLLKLKPAAPKGEPVRGLRFEATPAPAAERAAVTLEETDALRKAINEAIASAKTANANPAQATKLSKLGELHKALDEAVGSSTAISDEAKTAYANAVKLYRTQYAPRFKEGVNAQILAKGPWSQDTIFAEDVVKKYFSPGGATEAKQFVNLFGGNADATKIARSGIEDLYRQRVTDAAGIVDSGKHAAFMKEYARPLAILDDAGMGLKAKFAQIGDDAKRLEEVQRLATASGNKLAPPLPQSTNASAIQKRIDELTSKLNPAQLTAVNAVRDDLARAAEYQRLATIGAGGKQDLVSGAAEIPGASMAAAAIPGKGTLAASTVGYIFKKLTGAMDDKLALELARELSNPVLAEQTVAKALQTQASREARNALFSRYGARPVGIAASQMRSNPNAER